MVREPAVSRMLGSSRYEYRGERITLDEPLVGENHTLIYPWTMVCSEGRKESGKSYWFYLPHPPVDNEIVRDKIASVLFRMRERERNGERTASWRLPRPEPIQFVKTNSAA